MKSYDMLSIKLNREWLKCTCMGHALFLPKDESYDRWLVGRSGYQLSSEGVNPYSFVLDQESSLCWGEAAHLSSASRPFIEQVILPGICSSHAGLAKTGLEPVTVGSLDKCPVSWATVWLWWVFRLFPRLRYRGGFQSFPNLKIESDFCCIE